jgi:hypothetical protein
MAHHWAPPGLSSGIQTTQLHASSYLCLQPRISNHPAMPWLTVTSIAAHISSPTACSMHCGAHAQVQGWIACPENAYSRGRPPALASICPPKPITAEAPQFDGTKTHTHNHRQHA